MSEKFFTGYFRYVSEGMVSVNHEDLIRTSEKIKAVSNAGNKLIITGNGGSAAIASHVAVDFTGGHQGRKL